MNEPQTYPFQQGWEVQRRNGVPYQQFTLPSGETAWLPVEEPRGYSPRGEVLGGEPYFGQPLTGKLVESPTATPSKRSWPDAFKAYVTAEGVSGARALFVVATRLGFTGFTAFMAAVPGIGDDIVSGGLGIVDDAPVVVVVAYYLYKVSRYRRIEE